MIWSVQEVKLTIPPKTGCGKLLNVVNFVSGNEVVFLHHSHSIRDYGQVRVAGVVGEQIQANWCEPLTASSIIPAPDCFFCSRPSDWRVLVAPKQAGQPRAQAIVRA